MKKWLLLLLSAGHFYFVDGQSCAANISASGPLSFCAGGSVILSANIGNTWTQKADFGGNARNAYSSFSIGNKGYLGLGFDGTSYKKDFWSYDPATNAWTQKADFGGTGRRYAASFSMGSKGYIGTGYDGTGYKKDFWEYDTTNNAWTQRKDFGGVARDLASGFSIGTKGYIGTGNDGSFKKDFWEYNPANDTWTQRKDYGGTARNAATAFSIGTKGYIAMGTDGAFKKDIWEYDPSNDTWIAKSDFGGTARNSATSFNIGSKGYVGMGFDGGYKNDFWEFDPIANSWVRRVDFGGSGRNAATCFSIAGFGYIGLGFDGTYKKDFWQYSPALSYSWSNGAVTPFINVTTSNTYSVTVTNVATGCSAISSPVVVAANATNIITSATATTNPICSGSNTTLTANGVLGSNPVVTWWTGTGGTGTNLGTGTALLNAGPGTYYARVTGDCGTPAETSVTIATKTDLTIISASADNNFICPSSTTNLTANGVAGTNATVNWWTGAGGTGTNIGTGITMLNVAPGTYYARVTGDCGVPLEAVVMVNAKVVAGIGSATAAVSPICNSATTNVTANNVTGTNASVTWFTGVGGTGTNLGTGTTLSSQPPGSYYAYVSGDCGLPEEAVAIVQAKTDVSIVSATAAVNPICNYSTTNLTANGVAGDNATVNWWTGTGGTGTNLGTGAALSNRGPGTYYARVSGDCGIPAESVVIIGAKVPTSSVTNASNCNSYTWNGTNYKTSGTYTFQTINAAGCDSVATLNLVIFTTITSTYTKKNSACKTLATGSIKVSPTNGNAPFTYRIGTTGNFVTSNTFNGLKAGVYRISILDVNGCTGTSAQITIQQDTTITGIFTKTDITCNGLANGTIKVTPTSGTAPFTYQFGTAGTYGTSNTFSNLNIGDYRIYLKDANNCSINTSLNIQQPAPVTGTAVTQSTKCYGSSDGSLTVSPTGGIAPFTYKLNTTTAYTSATTFSALKAAVYVATIKDAKSCLGTTIATVPQPTVVSGSVIITNASCPSANNGSATVLPTGGVPPYTFRFGSTGLFVANNGTFNNLKPGSYRVYVKDSNNCSGFSIVFTIGSSSSSCAFARDNFNRATEESKKVSIIVSLSPNPTTHQFVLNTHGNKGQPFNIRVTDVMGRIVHQAQGQPEQTFRFGEQFSNGLYMVEVRQGEDVKMIKAVKGK
jgi:hypothetical protein